MPTDRKSVELNIPATAEERELLRISGGWDRWYGSLPQDLRRRLSLHDFKRLGDCFRQAFDIPDSHRPAAHEDAQDARRLEWMQKNVSAAIRAIGSIGGDLRQHIDAAMARAQHDEYCAIFADPRQFTGAGICTCGRAALAEEGR